MRVAAKTDCKVTWPETLASFGCWGSPFGEWDLRSGYLQVFGLQPEVSPGGQGDCSYLRCTEPRFLERCLLVPCLTHVMSILQSWLLGSVILGACPAMATTLQLRNGLVLKDADESLQYDMEIVRTAVKENWTV